MSWAYLYTKSPNVTETGDRLLPYGSGTLHLPGLEIDRPETRLKDYLLNSVVENIPPLFWPCLSICPIALFLEGPELPIMVRAEYRGGSQHSQC